MSGLNSIPSGYKQTEVGVIPMDWNAQNLGDVARVIGGGAFKSKDATQTGIRWLKIANVGVNKILWDDESFLPEHLAKTFNGFLLRGGDYVLALTRPILGGELKIAKIQEDDAPALLNQRVGRIESVNASDVQFLYYLFQKESSVSAMQQSMAGTDPPNLSTKGIYSIACAIPKSLVEQRAIATALSDVDALLAAQDKLIAKKRDIKQATMQQLLNGKQRLPGFSGEWELKRLGNLLHFQVGYPFSSGYFNQKTDGIRLVKNRDLKSDDQIFYYSGGIDDAFLVRNGDVLIGMDGDFLPCLWSKGPALLNQRVGRIVPHTGLDCSFAYYHLMGPLKAIEYATSCTTVKHLSHGDIENIELFMPEFDEQTAIAAVLSDMDADLAALEQQRDKTRSLKLGMMQELLTGRIRLIPKGELNA